VAQLFSHFFDDVENQYLLGGVSEGEPKVALTSFQKDKSLGSNG